MSIIGGFQTKIKTKIAYFSSAAGIVFMVTMNYIPDIQSWYYSLITSNNTPNNDKALLED